MPPRATNALTHLTGALARWVAVLAMLIQVVFFAEHLGATAVHAIGKVPVGERMGFLELCTGEGIVWLDPLTGQTSAPGGAPANHGSSDCAVCSSASVCSFDAPASAASPVLELALVPAPFVVVPAATDFVSPIARPGQIRAPPLA